VQAYLDARLSLIDAQSKMERDSMQRAISDMQKTSERQMNAVLELVKAQTAQPQRSVMDQLPAILAAMSPIVAAVMSKSADEKKALMEEMRAREERDAAQRAETFKILIASQEKAASASENTMKVIAPMVDAVSQMGRTVLQQVATMQELTQPQGQEEGWMGLAKEALRAFAEYQSAQTAARAAIPPPPPAQPQLAAVPQPQPQEGEGDDEGDITPDMIKTMDPGVLAQAFEENLRAKTDATEVAETFAGAVQVNAAFAELVGKAGGPVAFFQGRLGNEWASQNADYVRAVIGQLAQRGMRL
jgi:hypothetical protein